MRILQNAIAALFVLLATGPAAALATGPAAALATDPAVDIEITYSYSPDPSTAKPLNGALVDDPFYIFFDPGLPDDTTDANLFVDIGFPSRGESTTPPFSIRYDPSSLSPGQHWLWVIYNNITSSGPYQGKVHAWFWVGEQPGEVRFAVYGDSHICKPELYVGDYCKTSTQHDHRRWQLEDVGYSIRALDELVFALGDGVEDLYHPDYYDQVEPYVPSYYFRYVHDTFPDVPQLVVLGNHDIRTCQPYLKWFFKPECKWHILWDWAKYWFGSYSTNLGRLRFVTVEESRSMNGWGFYALNSGETAGTQAEGSCVSFSPQQLSALADYLTNAVSGKTAILFWHVSPEGEIRGTAPALCQETASAYLGILKDHAPKIKAIFTGHTHVPKSYIWNTTPDQSHPYGSVENNDEIDKNPLEMSKIMMITAPSTGFPPGDGSDYYIEVTVHPDGTLSIDNKNSIKWTPLCASEPPTPVYGESRYTQVDTCFEQDNNGDGWFNDDKIDCPSGTHMGAGLDYDSNQQAFTVEAELNPSGRVKDYIPGQYHAVSSADIGETALEDLRISQHYANCTSGAPPISKLNPSEGGGGVAVVVAGPDGVARQIADAKTRDYTDQTSGISVVAVERNDSYSEAYLENVPEGYHVSLYVQFAPGLKGKVFSEGSSCDVETSIWSNDIHSEDPVFAEDFALEVVDNK